MASTGGPLTFAQKMMLQKLQSSSGDVAATVTSSPSRVGVTSTPLHAPSPVVVPQSSGDDDPMTGVELYTVTPTKKVDQPISHRSGASITRPVLKQPNLSGPHCPGLHAASIEPASEIAAPRRQIGPHAHPSQISQHEVVKRTSTPIFPNQPILQAPAHVSPVKTMEMDVSSPQTEAKKNESTTVTQITKNSDSHADKSTNGAAAKDDPTSDALTEDSVRVLLDFANGQKIPATVPLNMTVGQARKTFADMADAKDAECFMYFRKGIDKGNL